MVQADITVEKAVTKSDSSFGRLDNAVAVADIGGALKALLEFKADYFERFMRVDVCVLGTLTVRHAVALMACSGGGATTQYHPFTESQGPAAWLR